MTPKQARELIGSYERLWKAEEAGRAESTCLKLWSRFVRTRDGNKCVNCGSRNRLSAHHIARKTLWSSAKLDTGNGLTLCFKCHQSPHERFNGRPNLGEPIDHEEGEKIELMLNLFQLLLQSAKERNLCVEEFYHLNPVTLLAFKRAQGFEPCTAFNGGSLEQACSIWSHCPQNLLRAVIGAAGFQGNVVQLRTGTMNVYLSRDADADRKP
jgi:hypothetical protein